MTQGAFITFEGIDGCGKSTQLAKAADYLASRGIEYMVTREPGGTAISEKIRDIILSNKNSEMKNSCELLLYLAARAQHVSEKILPALEEGKVVLCDRFHDATLAYQGFGRGYPLDTLNNLNAFAVSGLEPTQTFLFDITVDIAFDRLQKTGSTADRLESNSRAFFQKVREGYLSLASSHSSRITLLPAEKSIEELAQKVQEDISDLIN